MISEIKQKIIKFIYAHPFNEEIWNLESSFLEWIVPRLKLLKKNNISYPGYMTEEKWDKILDEMIDGFESNLERMDMLDETEENNKKLARSLHLFSKYFKHLWD